MLKRFQLLFLCCMLCSAMLWAQGRKITGRVTARTDGSPIPMATIKVAGTKTGVTADANGAFSITATGSDVLEVTSVGFNTVKIKVGEQESINVTLEENTTALKETVVTALNIRREKRQIGYAMESITGDKIAQSSAPNIVNALSGKMAGVVVTQPNGVEGGTTRLVLRANSSFTGNNQPLFIVDGVEFQNPPGMTSMNRGKDWGSYINNLNPNDIEDITVLKGPAASALYGAQGGNGVVIITTKKGGKKPGLGVEYAFDYRTTKPFMYMDMQNEYGSGGPISDLEPTLDKDASGNYILPKTWNKQHGPTTLPKQSGYNTYDIFSWYASSVSWGPKMQGQQVKWWDGQMRPYSPQPDNMKGYFRPGHTATHNVSFSGEGSLGSVRLSLTRTDNNAVVPNSDYNQTTVNLGSNLNISKKLKATIAMSYMDYYRKNSPSLGDDANSWGKATIYYYPRDYRDLGKGNYELPDGTRNLLTGYADSYWGDNQYIWWNTYNNNTYLRRKTLLGSVALTYDITDWLNIMGRSGLDFSNNNTEERKKPTDLTGLTGGYYGRSTGTDRSNSSDLIITFHKEKLARDLGLTARLGATRRVISNYTMSNYTDNFALPFFYSLSNVKGTAKLPSEGFYDKKTNSVYGLLDFSFRNYLFLELTGRKDWFSTLPLDNNNGKFFPSATLSFVFTDAFKLQSEWLSFGKLRAAAAKAASDREPYLMNRVYKNDMFGGNVTLSLPDSIPPKSLQPQTSRTVELGLNLGLLKNRINVDVTYYNTRSYNQILNAPVATSTGARAIWFNSGEMQNSGVEVQIDAKAIANKDFRWDIGLRLAKNKGKILSLDNTHPEVEFFDLDNLWDNYGPSIRLKKGDDYGTIYGYDYTYLNGQKIVSNDGTRYIPTKEKVPIGNATPKLTGGITNTFTYKNFSLGMLIDGKLGGDIYSGSYAIATMSGLTPETLKERDGGGLPYTDASGATRNVGVLLDGVYADGKTNDKVVHYIWKYMGNLGAGWGDWIDPNTKERHNFLNKPQVFDNTYLKMRELSLTYNVPESFLKRQHVIQHLNLSLVGRDLFYIYKNLPANINPEGINGAGNAQGLEWGALPAMRSYSVQVRVGF
ncbi:MAG TPA: SusC/RagA family TonB-linked outer membrane protein [Chitinophaga sp.]|uniref:SusC/RagA family TonB-linked outer membrane protein n=1 Tax=Chitinophaga sp. TaxID=1869181 RepID=UPI002B931C77|nr:SusC/RagA family TonB-linked outer membrane protein [Chitinophaga sp.]HVI43961.1 SusC/RagA family TonB-linked outer membrane protein [Chitinophaga sp.]